MKVTSQLIRFCAVGLACYLLGISVLAALTELVGLHYLISFAISFVVTGVVGFWLNARISFRGLGARDNRAVLRYLVVNAASLIANSVALAALVEAAGMWYVAAVIMLTVLNVPVNFTAHRFVTYRIHRATPAPDMQAGGTR